MATEGSELVCVNFSKILTNYKTDALNFNNSFSTHNSNDNASFSLGGGGGGNFRSSQTLYKSLQI